MAVAITRPVNAASDTSNLSSYSMLAFTPSANALLVLYSLSSGTVSRGAVSGGGLQWVPQMYITVGTDTLSVFWAKTPASPVSTTIVFDCSDDAATGNFLCCVELTGVDITTKNPIKQSITANATSTNARVIFAANVDTNNGYVVAWGGTLAAGSSAPPTSWTETADIGLGTPNRNFSEAYRATGETGTTFTFTNASTAWLAIGVEVYAAGAGPVFVSKQALTGVG